MKSFIKSSGFAILFFIANNIFTGVEKQSFTITHDSEKTILFQYNETHTQEFELQFKDNYGATLFEEYVVNPSTFERKYNLSELPNGSYFMYIKDNLKTQLVPIIIRTEDVSVILKKLKIVENLAAD